ncbi:MAG: bifunctional glutamate N-acetyltransferase/amino-acid acetyltransferase ArgJ [Candidatus Hydrogenedentota bacterium]
MKTVRGGITAPKGFKASGVHAGIKKNATKKDCALILSDVPATVAGTFTRNVMKSPPVFWNIERCEQGSARGVFINSGNANAATGDRGKRDVHKTVKHLSELLGVGEDDMCLCSTGVIGVHLPMDKITAGIAACAEALSAKGSLDAATAIMTTDTVAKEFAVEVTLSAGTIRMGAIAKGSGMVAPNMATMIAIITTDAEMKARALKHAIRSAVAESFNLISIDNDMSTSDTVLIFANGASGVEIKEGTKDYETFSAALTEFCRTIAKALVKDGEGATKFVEIAVEGAKDHEDAKTVARSIAYSQLVKTAFFGQDPNWGRIACAAGYAGVNFEPSDLGIWLDDVHIVHGGVVRDDYHEPDAAAVMKKPEFRVRVSIGHGEGKAMFWTSDLSQGYVSINADYRS